MNSKEPSLKPMSYNYLMPLGMLFITTLLAANYTAQKPIAILGFIMPGGIFIFPMVFILGDIVSEVYGYKWTRRMIYYAAACSILIAAYIKVIVMARPADFWTQAPAFEEVFRMSWLIFTVSIVSFILAGLANSFLLTKLKILVNGRYYWTRAISSTIVAVVVDNLIFIPIVFYDASTLSEKLRMSCGMFVVKVGYELLSLPFMSRIVGYLKHRENIDTYDRGTNFSPFVIDIAYDDANLYLKNVVLLNGPAK